MREITNWWISKNGGKFYQFVISRIFWEKIKHKNGGKFKLLKSWWSVFSYIYCALDCGIYFPILSSRRFTSYYNYVTREWHWVHRYEVSISHTVFEKHPKCRIWGFQFWHFPPIFVLSKLTCLVTMFDRKLQIDHFWNLKMNFVHSKCKCSS